MRKSTELANFDDFNAWNRGFLILSINFALSQKTARWKIIFYDKKFQFQKPLIAGSYFIWNVENQAEGIRFAH